MNEGLVCPGSGGGDPMNRMLREYAWLTAKCKAIVDANRNYESDAFWKILRKLILRNHIREFTKSVVHQLQDLVWQRFKQAPK
jgi:hypothetical protein